MRQIPFPLLVLLSLSACDAVSGDDPEVMYEGRYWRLGPLDEEPGFSGACDAAEEAVLEADRFFALEAHTIIEGDDAPWWVSAGVWGVRELPDGAVAFERVVQVSADGRDFVDASRWEAYLGEAPAPLLFGLDADGALVDDLALALNPDQRFHAESVTVDRSAGCVRMSIEGTARDLGADGLDEAPFATELTFAPVHPTALEGTILAPVYDAE